MAWIDNALIQLTKSLYPTGRAFAMPAPIEGDEFFVSEDDAYELVSEDDEPLISEESPIEIGGILYRLHRALAKSEARLYEAARSTFDSILPDNVNFTEQDALEWQGRLGITTQNTYLPAQTLAIQRKMNYPGSTAPRESALHLQEQLQAAGFPLFVYENPDGIIPEAFLGSSGNMIFGPAVRYGMYRFGQSRANQYKIVDYIEESKDAGFSVGNNYYSTFFIGGAALGTGLRFGPRTRFGPATRYGVNTTFAQVPATRQAELRQLILVIKPKQTVGFLFITYT